MNIPVIKPLIDEHNNICYWLKQKNIEKDNKMCHELEHVINHGEEI